MNPGGIERNAQRGRERLPRASESAVMAGIMNNEIKLEL
jgi:hypothetical protein